MELHPLSIGVGIFIFVFYHVTNYVLQLIFYHCRRHEATSWKSQPNVAPTTNDYTSAWIPWLPILEPFGFKKPGAPRYPLSWLLGTINSTLGALFALAATELHMRGYSLLRFGGAVTWWDALGVCWACTLEQIFEYFWHRAMHTATLYSWFHRIHHFNKAPSPFDDMLIHPVEACGYFVILYSPAFLVRMHWVGMCAYMSVMGLCGVIDHSGIKVSVPGFYQSEDHDKHHSHFIVNYAFPFPYMDLLMGTFDGEFLGYKIKPWARASLSKKSLDTHKSS